MGFWNGAFGFAGDHPFLTTLLVGVGGYGVYKLGSKALDVTERTANRAIKNRYSVITPKCSVRAYRSYYDEEKIFNDKAHAEAEDRK